MSLATRIRGVPELQIPPLERDGVVEEEMRSISETLWEGIHREVLEERIGGVGKQEGNIFGSGSREESGESGEGILGTDSNARNGPIEKNKNGIDGFNVILDLPLNTLDRKSVV